MFFKLSPFYLYRNTVYAPLKLYFIPKKLQYTISCMNFNLNFILETFNSNFPKCFSGIQRFTLCERNIYLEVI